MSINQIERVIVMTYTKEDFLNSLQKSGVNYGDIIMVHVGMSAFGALPMGIKNQDELSQFCLNCLKEAIGPNGTLFAPAFTYSLGNGEIFDAQNTPCPLVGPFCEFFRKQKGVYRSDDPFLSVCGIGKFAEELTSNISNTSYGEGSFFDNFTKIGGKIVCIGVGLRWATIRHYFEEKAGVPFRHKKRFDGYIIKNSKLKKCKWFYSVSPRCENALPLGEKLENIITESGLYKKTKLEKSFIGCIKASDYLRLSLIEFKKNPWISAKGPSCNLIAKERERVSGKTFCIKTHDCDILKILQTISNIAKYPLSDTLRESFRILEEKYNINILKYPTGTEYLNFLVPPRWICRDAYIQDKNGNKIFSFDDNEFGVKFNSPPLEVSISKEDLLSHVQEIKKSKKNTVISKKNRKRIWGFFLFKWQIKYILSSIQNKYFVKINSDYSYDNLLIGEYSTIFEGRKKFLLCTDLSSEVNATISTLIAVKELNKEKLSYSYTHLLLSGIDSFLIYLSDHSNFDGVIFISSKSKKNEKNLLNRH